MGKNVLDDKTKLCYNVVIGGKKMKLQEPKTVIDYINGVAKLYAERGTTSNDEDKELVNKKIRAYIDKYGNKTAKWSELEEAFAYCISSYVGVNESYASATESKLAILLRLLKQTGNISNSDYESALKQFKAINRDYKIERNKNNG